MTHTRLGKNHVAPVWKYSNTSFGAWSIIGAIAISLGEISHFPSFFRKRYLSANLQRHYARETREIYLFHARGAVQ
jgi:hypothetical protein